MVSVGPLHASSPAELKARLEAERAGAPFLVYRDGDGLQQIFPLEHRASLTVGRHAANDVALAWDTETSRVHAELAQIGGEWTISDDGLSSNGTYVNGRRVTGRRRLRDSDVIVFGQTQAVFRSPVAASLEETRRSASAERIPTLSPAQRRVLVSLCRPFKDTAPHAMPASNRQIADELVVSVEAVKANMRALFDSFGVEDLPQNRKRARLVELAFMTGVIAQRDL